jgi:hypothetical protein
MAKKATLQHFQPNGSCLLAFADHEPGNCPRHIVEDHTRLHSLSKCEVVYQVLQ